MEDSRVSAINSTAAREERNDFRGKFLFSIFNLGGGSIFITAPCAHNPYESNSG